MDTNPQSRAQTQNILTKKRNLKGGCLILIGIVVILGIIGSIGSESTPTPTNSADTGSSVTTKVAESSPAETERKIPEVTVTSAVLYKAYKENEVAADQKYKGKLIEISGKVTGVDNGTFDNEIIVKLSDGEYDWSGPWCYMKPSEHDKVVNYTKGQQVTLIGKGDSATIGSPILKDCLIKE